MTVLRWIASRCAVVTRLKPHSHQATMRLLEGAEVILSGQQLQLRPHEAGPRGGARRIEYLAHPDVRDLADLDAGAVPSELQGVLRVGA